MFREVFLGFMRMQILHQAKQGPVYGSALARYLKEQGYQVSPGTLYPTLHQLEQAGHLRRTEHVVGGKVRKYYHLTEAGAAALQEATARVRVLVQPLLADAMR